MADQRITGAQWEYLTALGEPVDPRTTKADASARIEKAKKKLDKTPTRKQRVTAQGWGLTIPDDANRRKATDILYRFIVARRWVYSVARKMIEAEKVWRTYADSGLPDAELNRIAHQVLADDNLVRAAEEATRGSSFTGSTWNRYTVKAVQAETFLQTASLIERHIPKQLAKARKRLRGKGCLMVIVAISIGLTIAGTVL